MPDVRYDETDRGPVLENGHLRVEAHLNKGTFDIIDMASGRTFLADAGASVSLRDGPVFRTRGEAFEVSGTDDVDDVHGTGLALVLLRDGDEGEPELSVTITLYEDCPFAIIRAEVQNLSPTAIRIQSLHPVEGATLDAGAPADALSFYKHGWQSWSPAIVLPTAAEDEPMSPPVTGPGTQPNVTPGRLTSDLVTAVADPVSGYGTVAGFVSAADQFSHVYFDRGPGTLSAVAWGDGVELAPKAVLASERLLVSAGDGVRGLERYGRALGEEMEALPFERVTSGWCSWYYYFQGVSEEEVLANLQYLAANKDTLPIEYVQIDDGYQSEIGDWLTPNDKFPHGMKWLADQIHERGYRAGLWLAPFLAGARSKLFQEHPQWFTKYSTGMPAIATVNWGQPCFALDLTNPEVLAWLETTFRTICDEWGYDYVKIDFIFAGAVDGVRSDPNVTRAQAYRHGLEVIRDAVGLRFVLACGNPMGPSVGWVNGARIGPDVAPYWYPAARQAARSSLSDPSAVNSIRNTITRWWMHGPLWANDPDCLLVRETDATMTGDEVRALTTVIGLTGGMVLNSDKLPKLSDARRDLISLLLPVYGKSARPIDLFRTPDIPQLLELDCGMHRVLGVFNWSDEPGEVTAPLPDGRWHAWELWEREYIGVVEGEVTLPVPPHGCRLLRLTPVLDRPQVVGSTLHITMGALEIAGEEWDGASLRITLSPVAKKDGELYVWRDGRVEAVEVRGLVEERVLEV